MSELSYNGSVDVSFRTPAKVAATQEMIVVACPRPGIGLQEAREKWLAAKDDQGKESNKVLDYGDKKSPVLLVARAKEKTVLYELVPELSPPGFTVQMMMEHMRKAGFDVRGIGPPSAKGNSTVVVCEKG